MSHILISYVEKDNGTLKCRSFHRTNTVLIIIWIMSEFTSLFAPSVRFLLLYGLWVCGSKLYLSGMQRKRLRKFMHTHAVWFAAPFCWNHPSIHVWRYSPFRALAFLKECLHSSLFSALLLRPLIPSSCSASLWTTSAHLVLGLLTGLVLWKIPFETFFWGCWNHTWFKLAWCRVSRTKVCNIRRDWSDVMAAVAPSASKVTRSYDVIHYAGIATSGQCSSSYVLAIIIPERKFHMSASQKEVSPISHKF
jgi:hypothetical protein